MRLDSIVSNFYSTASARRLLQQYLPIADSCTAQNSIFWTQVSADRCSGSICQSGRTPTLRAAHEDVTHPPASCVGELHTTHFAGARGRWRQVGNAGLDRCAEIAGTDMGIKRLGERGGRHDGGEDHGNGKLAHDNLSLDSEWPPHLHCDVHL
jgi:hypothetical protein